MEHRSEFSPASGARRPRSWLAVGVAVAAVAFAVLALLSSFGARWDWWHFRTGFGMLRIAAFGGLAVAALALIAVFLTRPGGRRRGIAPAVVGFVLGLATFVVLWQVQRLAQRVPPIHDVTTDMENPPEFVAVVPLRADAPNSLDYGGPEVAALQRGAYPDISPLIVQLPRDSVFHHALGAARDMGWEIVDADTAEGRIEATDVTFWYGFEDDVVVRLTQGDGRTVVDVRSVSRVGRGDLGVNARRVRKYLQRLEERL